jgi:hypothetical protein
MKRTLLILRRAEADIEQIDCWLARRSTPAGVADISRRLRPKADIAGSKSDWTGPIPAGIAQEGASCMNPMTRAFRTWRIYDPYRGRVARLTLDYRRCRPSASTAG